jgi:hypothetical protein
LSFARGRSRRCSGAVAIWDNSRWKSLSLFRNVSEGDMPDTCDTKSTGWPNGDTPITFGRHRGFTLTAGSVVSTTSIHSPYSDQLALFNMGIFCLSSGSLCKIHRDSGMACAF